MRGLSSLGHPSEPPGEAKGSSLLNQSSWALLAEILMLVGMAASFIILPSQLTPAEYGIVGGIQGLVAPSMEIALLGAPALLIRRVSHGEPVKWAWMRLNTANFYGSIVITMLLIVTKPWLLGPAPLLPYVLLVLANGFLAVTGDQLSLLHTSLERMDRTALMRGLYTVPRLLALFGLLLIPDPSLMTWALLFTAANFAGFVATRWHARRDHGLSYRVGSPRSMMADSRQSYGFALTGMSDSVLSVSDRPILVNSGFDSAAGTYTLATRFVSLAMMPSIALVRAATSRLYAAGKEGVRSSGRVATALMGPTVAIGVVSALALWFGAPLINLIVDPSYADVVPTVRFLALIPLVKTAQYLAGNALDAALFQFWRFRLTLAAAVVNLGLNAVFIPKYSWKAAVASTVLAEILLTLSLWAAVFVLGRRQDDSSPPVVAS